MTSNDNPVSAASSRPTMRSVALPLAVSMITGVRAALRSSRQSVRPSLARQHQIQHDQIDARSSGDALHFATVTRYRDLQAAALQKARQQMHVRRIIAAGAIALLLSPASFAATPKPDRCTRLESKFDQEASASTSADLAKAKTLRADGRKLCSSGNKVEGAKKLQEAVKMLGGGTTHHN